MAEIVASVFHQSMVWTCLAAESVLSLAQSAWSKFTLLDRV
jgi:hypothetical protein